MPPARLLMTAVRTASFRSVAPSRLAARVDQAGAAHVAVDDLITAEVDRMVARELVVDAGAVLPKLMTSKPRLVSGSFCLMMSAWIVTPRWLAWPVRSAAVS